MLKKVKMDEEFSGNTNIIIKYVLVDMLFRSGIVFPVKNMIKNNRNTCVNLCSFSILAILKL